MQRHCLFIPVYLFKVIFIANILRNIETSLWSRRKAHLMSSIMNIKSPLGQWLDRFGYLLSLIKDLSLLAQDPRDVIQTEGMCKIQLVTPSSPWGNRETKGTGLKVKPMLSSVLWILFSIPVVRILVLMAHDTIAG